MRRDKLGQERGRVGRLGDLYCTARHPHSSSNDRESGLDWRLHAGTLLWEWGIMAWEGFERAVRRGESMRL